MKREILFRGKCKRTGKWLYGDLVQWKSKGRCAITPQEGDKWESPSDFEVNPETVGRYTGNLDAKGNKVFEGDILRKINHWEAGKPYYTYHEVAWSKTYDMWYCFHTKNERKEKVTGNCFFYTYKFSAIFEITSNIHDQVKQKS